MSTLLSTWSRNVQSVPANYVFPEDKRPGGDIAAPVCKDIPVIDLSRLDDLDHVEIIQQIMKANHDLGMFQGLKFMNSTRLSPTMEYLKN